MQNTGDLMGQAWNYQREGKFDNALNSFEKAVKASPQDIDAVYGLGLAQKSTGRKTEAIKSFNQALELIEAHQKTLVHEENADHEYIRTPEEDRFVMLARMVNQRLAELGV